MQRHPTLNRMAEVTGKSAGTIHRWQRTNPELHRAVVEYVARIDKSEELYRDLAERVARLGKNQEK